MGGWVPPAVQIPQVPQVPACACCQGCHQCFPFLTWGRDAMAADQRFRNLYIYICIYIWLLVLYSYRIFIPIHELILPVDHGLQPQEALSIFDIWDTKNNSINRSCLRLDATQMFGDTNFPFRFLAVFKKQGEPPCDQHLIIQKVRRWLITEKMSASMGPTSDRPWSSSLIHH